MIIRTCLRPDEHMIYVPGTFIVYKLCGLSANANIREVPLTSELEYNLDAVLEVMDEKTKLVFVANPNNPTGTYIGRKSLESFLAQVPEHVLVVLDEAYFEYATAPDYPNGLEYLANRERLVVTRTFSKCYGLAGLRIGYAVGNGELIDFLNRGRQPFNVNSLAQVGALAALDDQEHVQKACDLNRKEMGRVVEGLTQLRIKCTPSQANFVLADFGQDVGPLFDRLLRQGVIVRPMQGYGFPHSARITIGTPEQNNKLFKAIETLETS